MPRMPRSPHRRPDAPDGLDTALAGLIWSAIGAACLIWGLTHGLPALSWLGGLTLAAVAIPWAVAARRAWLRSGGRRY